MISQQFNDQLNQFKIELKEDSLEYICNMPDDMMLTNHDEMRESTKVFLVGASINDMARNDFYHALFSSNDFKGKAFTSTASSGPAAAASTSEDDEPKIVAISQQNRFHTETWETLNKELDLPGVQLSPCTRYGLLGQKGVILHIPQLEGFVENTTVFQEVLVADPKATTVAILEYVRVKDKLDDATQLAIK
ncbi:hypothetical protein HMPREF1544_07126 [Mucor circinelloides 1006PhL]|uniref:Uncharacterized protein n=1 Tax=Mucor circinelloides f. circinelloides (strain 1006PhL) TaxID=1220926 RepID=S2K1K7_MUCC1|nr:hypothetical protein HMPREF1544_07120 [Mucor circinelloides 1006PhL]EPB86050.1 hypothetical protein HMPREF1544_07126 [Mucor circinelloides 1006PhL]